jgi:hypothetical protein
MKVPLLENTCILLLPVSATYTLPEEESNAIPAGDLISPSSPPYCPPHFVMKVPLLENADGERYNDEHTKVTEIANSIETLYQRK